MKISDFDNILIGLFLMSIAAALYSFYNNENLENDELNWISGTLSETPYNGSHGGETSYSYIRFFVDDLDNKFYTR
ncbi:hypothetical protein [Reichenbachiella sp.]